MANPPKKQNDKNEETVILPLLPVKDTVIFPTIYSPLFVGREPSLVAIDKALAGEKTIFLTAQKNEREDMPKPNGLHQTGCVASIVRVHKLPTGTMKILVQGTRRAKIVRFIETSPFMQVEVSYVEDVAVDESVQEASRAVMHAIRENLEKMISLGKMLSPDLLISVDDIADPGKFADLVAAKFGFEIDELQEILETSDPVERLEKVSDLVLSEMEALNSRRDNEFPRMEFPQGRREQFLRDQLKAIRNELGENDPRAEEVQDYKRRIRNAQLPQDVRNEAEKQSRRLEGMHPEAAEASIVRTYLDYLIEVPWLVASEENLDLVRAKEVLDRDHYGLDLVKDRILEFLGVCKLKSNMKGPILCLVGPPGVGKTSLGKSIASAMGRNFVRSSLGGVKDEAEIRGHRRTYVGAMPGKIIQGIKQAGSNNPVFILDEIDKLGADFRGDPSSALLEVLDPEQNDTFKDHYLNLPFNLSNVMFIATANVIENIPRALRDRMEVIRIAGYTPEEKLEICKTYLFPKQLEANGISSRYLKMNKRVFLGVVENYTRESGVRELERKVGTICRKVARKVAEGETKTITVQEKNLHEFLGAAKFRSEVEKEDVGIGCALGLAWTEYGGDVLLIEVGLMPGKGEMVLTGSLGDVMKESVRAAMTYVRSNSDRWKISDALFKTMDVHVHFPDGATPKDGPSAGITIVTSIVSAFTKTAVRNDIAMTGEVTIRGRVLQVGGVKEKILAAKRRKVSTILIPEKCLADLEDVPEALKEGVEIIPVKTVDEVLDLALVGGVAGLVKEGRKSKDDKTSMKPEATA
jgi:ATP-dependent Lon protease